MNGGVAEQCDEIEAVFRRSPIETLVELEVLVEHVRKSPQAGQFKFFLFHYGIA